jgi:predicted methyltransferase
MKRSLFVVPALLTLAACGPSPAYDPEPAAPKPAPIASASPAPATTPAPAAAEPTPEEKKKAEARAALEKDRAAMMADLEKEKARWTPELRSQAKALADKTYPTGKAAIQAAMASKHRKPGHDARDKQRHPLETLEFFGFKPNMTVLEYGPGEGWYTELLAPSLASKGKLLATNGDPKGPVDERSTFYAQRVQGFLDTSPEAYGKVEVVTVDGKAPKLGLDSKVDLVLLMRGMHGMVNSGKLDEWLKEIHTALKPNGVLGVEQHRAAPTATAEESAKKGYLPEKWVIEKVEAAGFKFVAKSEINANPKDTKDYAEGVWALPPTFALGDKDREKYAAIGESDRMTLKFTKVQAKPAAKADVKAEVKPETAKKAEPAKK